MRRSLTWTVLALGLVTLALVAWSVAVFRERVLDNLGVMAGSHLELEADKVMDGLGRDLSALSLTLQQEPVLRSALAARDTETLSAVLASRFHQRAVTSGEVPLERLYVYDDAMQLVAAAAADAGGTFREEVACPGVVRGAAARSGPERLQVVSTLCAGEWAPHYVTLVPIGGLRVRGYLFAVADPVPALRELEAEQQMPLDVRRPSGTLLYRSPGWPEDPSTRGFTAEYTLEGQGGAALELQVYQDLSPLFAALDRVRRLVLFITALVTAAAVALGLAWITRTTLRPLGGLSRHLQRIGADRGHLAETVPEEGSAEVRGLARQINQMGCALHEAYVDQAAANQRLEAAIARRERAEADLRAARDELEQRVNDRTENLKRINARLLAEMRERQEAEAALARARDQAECASTAKSGFLSRTGRDLRAPLNSILGFAQLIGEQADRLSAEQRRYLEQIEEGGWSLLRMVDQLLDFARLEQEPDGLAVADVALEPLLGGCVEQERPHAEAAGLKGIRLYVDPAAQAVRADPARLLEVIRHLLANAVRYNRPRGSVRLRAVPVSGPVAGDAEAGVAGWVRISVQDTGPGIPTRRMETLFQPYAFPAPRREDETDPGIGLALCKRHVERMGGAMGVESRRGRGSTFWVELPAAGFPDKGARGFLPKPAAAVEEGTSASPCEVPDVVLYVEDAVPARVLMEAFFRRNLRAVTLLTAATGREGLALAREHRPGLILLDIGLPGMDGFEMLARLREDPATRGIPVWAVSAETSPAQVERAREAGFAHYLTKPVRLNLLLARLRGLAAPAFPVPDA